MINKLTPTQEKLMIEKKNEWLDYIFSCKNSINREKAALSIEWLYNLAGYQKPIIIFLDSPLACQYGALYVKELDKFLKLGESQLWRQVERQVRSQVESQLWRQVERQVRSQRLSYEEFAYYGSIWDYSWVSFMDFFKAIGVVKEPNFDRFIEYLKSGIYDCIQLNGYCIVSDMPNKILRNNERLHSENQSAISFKDGYELYFWKGVCVPEQWIKSPNTLTKQTIMEEKNAEKRRCIMEIVGPEKYSQLLGVEVIDEDIDHQGYSQRLLKSKEKDDLADDFLYFADVTCPSTERRYFIPVPEFRSIWKAKAWTFQDKPIMYRQGDVALVKVGEIPSKPLIET